jgi:hypothetical protein
VDGLKLVCHELAKAAGDPDSGALDDPTKDADLLVSTLFIKGLLPGLVNMYSTHLCRYTYSMVFLVH